MSIAFNDTTTKNGLIQVCEDEVFGNYGDISSNTDRLYQFTRLINEGLNRVTALLLSVDGRWQFDDTNYTDLPIGKTNLVTTLGSEQQDYAFAVSHLKILGVEVLDSTGNWVQLDPIDQRDIKSGTITDFMKTAGMPQYYDKVGNSILLYPKPAANQVTSTQGLKVRFQRPPSYFSYDDTIKTPGFNSLYHNLVALIASRDYAMSKTLQNARGLSDRVLLMETALLDTINNRSKDEQIQIRPIIRNTK